MRRVLLATCVLALAVGGGCGLYESEKEEILEGVAQVVQVRAAAEVEKALVKEGILPAEAKKVAAIAVRTIEDLVRKLLKAEKDGEAAPTPAASP